MVNQTLHHHSPEEQRRLSELFNKLDVNNDGVIDINDLTTALHQMEVHHFPGQAKSYFEKYDHDQDGKIDYHDFLNYYIEHEKELRLKFDRIDRNKDGYIDAHEIQVSFKNLGIDLSDTEAGALLKRMDKDKTLQISWSEWRDFHVLNPHIDDIHDLIDYWRHATIIDMGEDALVPDDFTETEMQSGMWWRHLVAGGVAGATSRTCTAPLDRIKVMLQVHGNSQGQLGISSWFHKMLHEGGMKSLWRGNGINVLKIAPETAIKFSAYEQIKRLIKGPGKDHEVSVVERFVAGSMAGATAQTAIYPMEVVKTRLVIRHTGQYKGILDCARSIYRTEGLHSFYRGYVPNILGIIPYAGIDLAVYETLKHWYMTNHSPNDVPSNLVLMAFATTATTCGQIFSYPLALIRTKLQAQPPFVQGHTPSSLFKSIWQTEGVRGLYRGIAPNMLKVAPAVSISYITYEHMRRHLGIPSRVPARTNNSNDGKAGTAGVAGESKVKVTTIKDAGKGSKTS